MEMLKDGQLAMLTTQAVHTLLSHASCNSPEGACDLTLAGAWADAIDALCLENRHFPSSGRTPMTHGPEARWVTEDGRTVTVNVTVEPPPRLLSLGTEVIVSGNGSVRYGMAFEVIEMGPTFIVSEMVGHMLAESITKSGVGSSDADKCWITEDGCWVYDRRHLAGDSAVWRYPLVNGRYYLSAPLDWVVAERSATDQVVS